MPGFDAGALTMTEIEKTISRYLRASAGTGNHPTDHTLRCFLGMIETGEATVDDFHKIGGMFIVNEIQRLANTFDPPIKL